MTGVERPITREKHAVSPAHNSARSRKQTVAGRTPGPHFTPSGCRKTSRVWSDEREYWVYAHRSADGSVLYVGCTVDRPGRERAHRGGSAWHPQVARTDYLGPFNRADGLRIERRLIEKHDPPHNFMHTSRYVHWRSQKAAS